MDLLLWSLSYCAFDPMGYWCLRSTTRTVAQPRVWMIFRQCAQAFHLRASHTPSTVSPMPSNASPVSVSPNSNQAISAVVGGVR